MKLIKQSDQIKSLAKPGLERYHTDIIRSEDIKSIKVKVFDNEPHTGHVYENGRYRTIWEIWDRQTDLDAPATHRLTNKLSNYKTFKNCMYTEEHKPYYVDVVNKCRQTIEQNPEVTVLQCCLGSKPRAGVPFLRMPMFAGQFAFGGDQCSGYLYIHEYCFEFEAVKQLWELDKEGDRASYEQTYNFQ